MKRLLVVVLLCALLIACGSSTGHLTVTSTPRAMPTSAASVSATVAATPPTPGVQPASTPGPALSATSPPRAVPGVPPLVIEVVAAGRIGDTQKLESLIAPDFDYGTTSESGTRGARAITLLRDEYQGGLTFEAAGPANSSASWTRASQIVIFKRAMDGRDATGVVWANPRAIVGVPTCLYLSDTAILGASFGCEGRLYLASIYPIP